MSSMFASAEEASARLAGAGYLPSREIATAVFLADRLEKPVLVEGPAGVGKTELGRAFAVAIGGAGTLAQAADRIAAEGNVFFSERFLLPRPILQAITSQVPVLLLVDEVDKADPEFEALDRKSVV